MNIWHIHILLCDAFHHTRECMLMNFMYVNITPGPYCKNAWYMTGLLVTILQFFHWDILENE